MQNQKAKFISIEEAWEKFRKGALSPKCPPIQLQEMEKSFRAGFYMLLEIMTVHLSALPDEVGVEHLERYCQERNAYLKKLKG